MRTPEGKTLTFTLVSHPVKDVKARWAANVTFAGGIGEGAILPIAVEDGEGVPVANGVFEFAGCEIPVAGGRGEIPYAAFVRGRHEKPIWLKRPGMEPVPGTLTFA